MPFASDLTVAARYWRPPDRATPPKPGSQAAQRRTNKTYCTEYIISSGRSRLSAYVRLVFSIRVRAQVPNGLVLASGGLWLQDQVPSGNLLVVADDTTIASLDFSIPAVLRRAPFIKPRLSEALGVKQCRKTRYKIREGPNRSGEPE
jgi:hypothetical protein